MSLKRLLCFIGRHDYHNVPKTFEHATKFKAIELYWIVRQLTPAQFSACNISLERSLNQKHLQVNKAKILCTIHDSVCVRCNNVDLAFTKILSGAEKAISEACTKNQRDAARNNEYEEMVKKARMIYFDERPAHTLITDGKLSIAEPHNGRVSIPRSHK